MQVYRSHTVHVRADPSFVYSSMYIQHRRGGGTGRGGRREGVKEGGREGNNLNFVAERCYSDTHRTMASSLDSRVSCDHTHFPHRPESHHARGDCTPGQNTRHQHCGRDWG